MEANTTIKALKTYYKGTPVEINDSLVISGIVISSDREGNLYRTLYIEDSTGGIEVKIGKTGLYNDYPVGMRLYVLCHGLTLGSYGKMVNLGWSDETGNYETAYLDVQYIINRHIFRGEVEDSPTPVEITSSSQISSANLGKLVAIRGALATTGGTVYIDGVTYPITTWAVSSSSETGDGSAYSGNQNFSLGSRKFVVRTSGYAKFADEEAPAIGSTVDMTGILTIYNSTYQLVLNSSDDVTVL
ncbi:MAG: DUF5689 domain-containing protein [Bacteroidales bacterium]|nr:DUF5689 domain-containing protein [Bacteroidales bacterium]